MSTLFQRLTHAPEAIADGDKIGVHYFYAAMVAYRDGVLTRSQLESRFNIGTGVPDGPQLTWILNALDTAVDKERFLNAVHAVFMASEQVTLTQTQAQNWLTIAAS